MDFCLANTVGNTRFTVKIYDSSTNGINNGLDTAMYYFLERGSFCAGQPSGFTEEFTLLLDIAGTPSNPVAGELFTITPAIMLQLLEILEAINKNTDMLELETMALALYSSSSSFTHANHYVEPINFKEAKQVYSVVQEWKRSPQRIKGTFNQYKPAGMSRHRFLNLINQLYNCSAAQLIYDINMQKAMDLLLTSGQSIITVSELFGYTNKENFITAFRNAYGVTPGYLRKQFR